MNKLQRQARLQKEGIDESHFFEHLLSIIVEKNYLSAEEVKSIQFQLVSLFTSQMEAYNAGKSSSMPKKQAERLMQSIYFTLGFYFKRLMDLDETITLMKSSPIKELFEKGQGLIKEEVENIQYVFEELKTELLPVENIAYQDTYRGGLNPFFKLYNLKYESHEIPASIDYPLSNDDMKQIGAEYISSYIEKSVLEHNLCLKFPFAEIEELLKSYHEGYKHLLINIYELVLMNAIGRILLGKSLDSLRIEKEEIHLLEGQLRIQTDEGLDQILQEGAKECLQRLDLLSPEMNDYIHQTVSKFIPHVKEALKQGILGQIFIAVGEEVNQKITYLGSEKLEDEVFKVLTEEIRSCKQVGDKVKWIKEKIRNVEDLKDLLEADCIFEKEYKAVYEALSDIEIALLLSLTIESCFEPTLLEHQTNEREWQKALNDYLMVQKEDRRLEILELAKRIEREED